MKLGAFLWSLNSNDVLCSEFALSDDVSLLLTCFVNFCTTTPRLMFFINNTKEHIDWTIIAEHYYGCYTSFVVEVHYMTTYNYFVRPHEGFCFFQLSIMSKRNTAFKVSMLDGEDSNQDPIQNWAKLHDNHSVRCLLSQEIVSIAQREKDQIIHHFKTGTHIKRRQNNLGDDRKLKRLVDTQRNIQTCFASGSAGADDGREDWQKRSLNNNVT